MLQYLGHIVLAAGVAPGPSKINVIVDWPSLSNPIALRGFLGLTCFYKRFIKDYANLMALLTTLLWKNQLNWIPESQQTFDKLNFVMTHTPVLVLLDFSIPFILEMDASSYAMGVVLVQRHRLF